MIGPLTLLALCLTSSAPLPDGLPHLEFARPIVDLGRYTSLKPVEVPFEFINKSPYPVTLDFDQCHQCELPRTDKKIYPPGDSGIITITFNPDGRRGQVESLTTVVVPRGTLPRVPLRIVADVRPRAWIAGQMTAIEAIEGRGAEAVVMVVGRGKGFSVLGAEVEPGGVVTTRVGTPETFMEDGEACVGVPVVLGVPGEAGVGQSDGVLRVKVADEEEAGTLTSVVSVRVRPGLIAEPIAVLLGRKQVRSVAQGRFVLTRADGGPVVVRSVELVGPDAERVWSPVVDAIAGPGLLSVEIVVTCVVPERIGGPNAAELIVRVVGEGGRGPATVEVPVRFGIGY